MTSPKNPPQQPIDIPEDYRQVVNDVYHAWHDGSLSFADTLKKFDEMREAAAGDILKLGALDNILGIVYGYRSSYDDSIKYFESAHEHFDKAGAVRRKITCDLNLGETYRLKGNYTRARSYFHRASEEGKTIGSLRTQSTALANEGQLWITLDSLEKARTCLEQSLEYIEAPWPAIDIIANEAATQAARTDGKCEIHYALAIICLRENNNTQAWEHAKQSLALAQEVDRPIRLGFANRALGEVITALEQVPEDEFENDPDIYYKAAIKAFRQVKADGEIAKTQYAQAQSLAKRGNNRRASSLFQKAMLTFTKLGMTNEAAKAAEQQLKVF